AVVNNGMFSSFLAIADLNADGKPDLVVVSGTGNLAILIGKGDGTFQAPIKSLRPAPDNGVAVGDFNGDGTADIAIADPIQSGSIAIMTGIGNGTFQPIVSYALPSFTYSMA